MGQKRVDGIKDRLVYKEGTSRQYQDQLRYKALGLCIRCQKPIWKGISKNFCEKHHLWTREYYRKYMGRTNTYRALNCKSYVMQKESSNE